MLDITINGDSKAITFDNGSKKDVFASNSIRYEILDSKDILFYVWGKYKLSENISRIRINGEVLNAETIEEQLSVLFSLGSDSLSGGSGSTKEIEITLDRDDYNLEDIAVQFAPLKYNKQFAFSMTGDDNKLEGWSRVFKYITGGFIDNNQQGSYYHKHMQKPAGGYAPRMLTYSDGCGVKRVFPLSTSNFYNLRTQYIQYHLERENPNASYPYLVWDEVKEMLDFDGGCTMHDVQDPNDEVKDDSTLEKIINGIIDANENHVKPFIGRYLNVMSEPNGNSLYADAAQDISYFKMITQNKEPGIAEVNDRFTYKNMANSLQNVNKLRTGRFFIDSLTLAAIQTEFKQNLVDASTANNRMYGEFGFHGMDNSSNTYYNYQNMKYSVKGAFLDWVHNNYGSDGDDSMWFCTNDEMVQYKILSRDTLIQKTLSGNKLKVKLLIPQYSNFYWSEFTLLVQGAEIESANSKDAIGLSYKSDLVNVNFDETLIERSDRYTSIFEQSGDEHDKANAEYFVQRLKPELQTSYMDRMAAV